MIARVETSVTASMSAARQSMYISSHSEGQQDIMHIIYIECFTIDWFVTLRENAI